MLTPETLSVPDSRYVPGEQHELAEFTIGNVKLGPLKVRSVKAQIPGVQGLLGFNFSTSTSSASTPVAAP